MKLTIIAATGGVGAELLEQAVAAGHDVTAVVRNPGKLVTQRELLREVWGPTYTSETHYLRQYMAQLRRKLEDEPSRPHQLVTEPGMGYRFRPASGE